MCEFFLGRGTNTGRLGEGGGEKRRWLKLNRAEVEERGALSVLLYEALRRRLSLGGAIMTFGCVNERSSGGTMVTMVQ